VTRRDVQFRAPTVTCLGTGRGLPGVQRLGCRGWYKQAGREVINISGPLDVSGRMITGCKGRSRSFQLTSKMKGRVMSGHTETQGINTPFMPPILARKRNIAAIQSAEDSILASELAKRLHPCPAGKIMQDGCCIYPLSSEAEGNWNYLIYNSCNPLKALQLVFQITTDMEAEYDLELDGAQTPPSGTLTQLATQGVVVQFNCYSKDVGTKKDPGGMVQYIFYVQGQTITPHIQYVSGTPDGSDHDWAPGPFSGLALPKNNTLPAGYSLSLWTTTDQDGYVNEVIFGVQDKDGTWHQLSAPPANIYPLRILEFQTNVVSTNGHYVHYKTGGAGTLYYTSTAQMNGDESQQLCVEGGGYDHCVASGLRTSESSNATYGFLDFCCTTEKSAWTIRQSVVAT
jgi:hypothetical protein